ncbi:MAG TPA: (2Fe-2S) ferredoxin domain-containing protein [Herpetosiphonaceae bacterium]|nr:(2Fe-2S) ferredoxin domain-containing protein [Herpetosiphonaceae bacterium]
MHYRVYICTGPHCGPQSADLERAFECAIAAADLADQVGLRSGGCLSRCGRGPNAMVHPGGVAYVGLDAASVSAIVRQHFKDGQPLRSHTDSQG